MNAHGYPGQAPCPHCFESSGYMGRVHSATWDEPAWEDADPTRPCPYCNGTGTVDSPLATLDDLENLAAEEAEVFASEPAIWTETNPGVFQVRLNENATFLVVQEGARYSALLPGMGWMRGLWTRNQVERLCRDHHENPPPEEEEDDPEDIGPSPESLRRWHEGRVL